MKKIFRLNNLFTALFLLSFTLVSCSKEDAITPSLDSSKVIGEWSVKEIKSNGTNIMETDPSYKQAMMFKSDGYFSFNFTLRQGNRTTFMEPFGSWKMTSSNVVHLTYFSSKETDIKIIKSTATELDIELKDDDYGILLIHSVKN